MSNESLSVNKGYPAASKVLTSCDATINCTHPSCLLSELPSLVDTAPLILNPAFLTVP